MVRSAAAFRIFRLFCFTVVHPSICLLCYLLQNCCTKSNQIWAVTWDFQQCGMCDHQSLRSACAYPQSDQSLCSSFEYSMSVKLLIEHHLRFLSLKGGYTGSSESTLVKMPHCWKVTCLRKEIIFISPYPPTQESWGEVKNYKCGRADP